MTSMEVIDNLIQLVAMFCCVIWSGFMAYKSSEKKYFILCSSYVCWMLGTLFWVLHLIILSYTPKIFCVSELSWTAAYLFFLSLSIACTEAEEGKFHPPIALVPPILIGGITLIFAIRNSMPLVTLLWGSVMAVEGYFSLRGLLYSQLKGSKNKFLLNLLLLAVLFLQGALFVVSSFTSDYSHFNLYFLIDFLLTVSVVCLLPALIKEVKAA